MLWDVVVGATASCSAPGLMLSASGTHYSASGDAVVW
jgi:hypothetical protein